MRIRTRSSHRSTPTVASAWHVRYRRRLFADGSSSTERLVRHAQNIGGGAEDCDRAGSSALSPTCSIPLAVRWYGAAPRCRYATIPCDQSDHLLRSDGRHWPVSEVLAADGPVSNARHRRQRRSERRSAPSLTSERGSRGWGRRLTFRSARPTSCTTHWPTTMSDNQGLH